MNLVELKKLLAVPTRSHHEQQMVAHLKEHLSGKKAMVWSDRFHNVYAIKGNSDRPLPCIAAHLDTVQPLRKVTVVEDNGYLRGVFNDKPAGLGADDKTGIHVALQLFERFDHIALAFFAAEEVGCQGAFKADSRFFKKLGYLIEYDCPSRHMLSYTASGERLFANRGDFITKAFPVLQRHGTTLWQHHPYTDVMAIRRRFPLSCLNLSSGYYRWHMEDEFVSLRDMALAIEQGQELIEELGCERYPFKVGQLDEDQPLCRVTGLMVPDP